jgi:hypothetical protein
VIHVVYVVVCFLIKDDVGQEQWKWYLDTHLGHHDFQSILHFSSYGIALQWGGESTIRPNCLHQTTFVSCNCGKCVVCLNGITNGIVHPPSKRAKVTVEYVCRKRVRMNECTSNQGSLGIKLGEYFWMCYQKQLSTELSAQGIK